MTTKEKAKEFLQNITEKDKVGLIIHDDLDGIGSGIIMERYLEKIGCTIKIETYNYALQKEISGITKNLASCNKIIILDIAPSGVNNLSELYADKEVLNIDHHPKDVSIPSEVIEYRSENYIPASRMVYDLLLEIDKETERSDWLALASVISDAGERYPENHRWIENILDKYEMDFMNFKKTDVFKISNTLVYFNEDLKEAYKIIKNLKIIQEIKNLEKYSVPIEEEIRKFEKDFEKSSEKFNKINLFYFEPQFKIKSLISTKISFKNPKEIFVFITPNKGNMDVSARNQSKEYNVADLLKKAVEGLKDSLAGGHKSAAGGSFLKKDLEKFKENLKKLSEDLK